MNNENNADNSKENNNNTNNSNNNNNQDKNVNNTQPSTGPVKEAEVVSPKKPENSNPDSTPEERNRRIMRIIGIILAIIVLLAIFGLIPGKNSAPKEVTTETEQLPEGCEPGYLFSETTGKPCPKPGETVVDESIAPAEDNAPDQSQNSGSSAYEEALAKYAGKIIAFDASCKAMPESVEASAGTRVLVANNSTQKATIAVGDERTEELDPYHYFTVNLKNAGEYSVSCNDNKTAKFIVK